MKGHRSRSEIQAAAERRQRVLTGMKEEYMMGTMATMVDDKIRVSLVRSSCYTRYPCHICGGTTDKVAVLAEVETEVPF
jgi:rRNA maturation endonuclease Nob1